MENNLKDEQRLLEQVEIDYLTSLQQRRKWKHPAPNLKEDQIVLVKDENTSPDCL